MPNLALVVGAARSGTTLLRVILDAHTEIGCPAEAGLPALMAHMAQVWLTVDVDAESVSVGGDPGEMAAHRPVEARGLGGTQDHADPSGADMNALGDVPEAGREWIRRALRDVTARYCHRENKRVYIDKSLDSVYHLGLVHLLFPEARYVLVVRHVMDTVASGLEASPWGFQAYGYAPYVQASPGNFVAALVSYWLDHVEGALRWESDHRKLCRRVRYEDL